MKKIVPVLIMIGMALCVFIGYLGYRAVQKYWPTKEPADLEAMNNEEKRIYWLVVRRFLACFFPNYEYESLKAVLTCEGQRFTAAGRAELNLGWKRAEQLRDEEEQEEQSLPPLEKGQTFPMKSFQLTELFS